jgi:nitrate reductase NapAB chaperone NapD
MLISFTGVLSTACVMIVIDYQGLSININQYRLLSINITDYRLLTPRAIPWHICSVVVQFSSAARINIICWSVFICLCHVVLYAKHSTVSSASANIPCLPESTVYRNHGKQVSSTVDISCFILQPSKQGT